jgi:hypothetical protein
LEYAFVFYPAEALHGEHTNVHIALTMLFLAVFLLSTGFVSLLGSARRPRLGPTSTQGDANGRGHFLALGQDQGSQRRIGIGRGTGRKGRYGDVARAAFKSGRSSLVAGIRWYQGEN